jgi:hypothetical protein
MFSSKGESMDTLSCQCFLILLYLLSCISVCTILYYFNPNTRVMGLFVSKAARKYQIYFEY